LPPRRIILLGGSFLLGIYICPIPHTSREDKKSKKPTIFLRSALEKTGKVCYNKEEIAFYSKRRRV
jgi:hypothetical protein